MGIDLRSKGLKFAPKLGRASSCVFESRGYWFCKFQVTDHLRILGGIGAIGSIDDQ